MPSTFTQDLSFDVQLSQIERAAQESAFGFGKQRPSERACAAGNYKIGRFTWQGIAVCIEQPRGSVRAKISKATGAAWQSTMAAHYGYVQGVKGADGDALDCFVGSSPSSEIVYVINQAFDGRFDEHKVMLCFANEQAARAAYLGSYQPGWQGLGDVVGMTLKQFRWWLKYANLSVPATAEHLPYEHSMQDISMKHTGWGSDAQPTGRTVDQLLYAIRSDDGADGLLLDSASVVDILSDPENESVLLLDALVTPFQGVEARMGALQHAMDRVSGVTVKTAGMQVSAPFKQRGTAQVAVVYELTDGQTVSVYLHNPDADPSKINADDELVSWKWMLNKKDLTIVVAPENGKDLNVREVSRRIMRLADKNSAAFSKANAKRSERLQAIEGLKSEVTQLEGELKAAEKDLELARLELDEWQLAQLEAEKQLDADKAAEQNARGNVKWWDTPNAAKYSTVYLIGKSRGNEYVTLEAKGAEYEARVAQSGIFQSKTAAPQGIYEWLASTVLTGMGHAMQGKSLSREEMAAKLKLVKGEDVLSVALPAKKKAVTKKEAVAAFEVLQNIERRDLSYGRPSLEDLARIDVADILPAVELVEELIARGLPEMPAHMDMPKLVERVRAAMANLPVAKARAAGDFGGVGELIAAVHKELLALGWTSTKSREADAEDQDNGRSIVSVLWAAESPRGTEVVMRPDHSMPDEIDFSDSFDYIARVGDDPAIVARGIDSKDWAENSDDAPYSEEGIVQDEDSEFFGKSLEFVRANLELEKAADKAGAQIVWGDFTASLHTGSLFDGASHFGVSAQIGKGTQVALRASISDGGFVTLYAGAAGDAVALESADLKAVAVKVIELVQALPVAQEQGYQDEQPALKKEAEQSQPDTMMARVNALFKASPKDDIYDTDPDAIEKLRAKISYLEGYSELMREANKLVRKNDRAGLLAMGIRESTVDTLFKPDFAGRVGFPDYELKNNNANARRLQKRLDALEKAAAQVALPDWMQGKSRADLAQMRSMYMDMLNKDQMQGEGARFVTERIERINQEIGAPEQVAQNGKEYRYALVYRPAGPGATPSNGIVRVEDAPDSIKEFARHGVAVYNRELSAQELKSFEMRRIHTEAERADVVEKLARHFSEGEHASSYYDYVQEGDMAMMVESVKQELWQQYPADTFPNMNAIPAEAAARFAELMAAKQPEPDQPASATVDPERAKAMQYLQSVVDGKVDPLTVDFDNLESIHEAFGSDEAVATLFAAAADVVANAALAATV